MKKIMLFISLSMSLSVFGNNLINAQEKDDFVIIEDMKKDINNESKEKQDQKKDINNESKEKQDQKKDINNESKEEQNQKKSINNDNKEKKEEKNNINNIEGEKGDSKKNKEQKEDKGEKEKQEESKVDNIKYNVMFKSFWCEKSHEKDFPEGGKFCDFVGIVHNKKADLWKENGSATDGLKQLVEDGKFRKIEKQIKRGKQILTVKDKFYLKGVSECKGSSNIEIEVNELYPIVSIAGKISPSPDWFTGVSNVSLCEDGKWIDKKIIIVYAYDGGTKEGSTYTDKGKDTEPHDKITKIEREPFIKAGELIPIGSFVFVKDNQ